MAEVITDNIILIPGRYLIQMDEGSCIGTIIQKPDSSWGDFSPNFSTKRTFGPEIIPEPPEQPEPSVTVEYTRAIVKLDGIQEINVNGVDYALVHSNDILAFIEPE